jgi:ribonuclease T1
MIRRLLLILFFIPASATAFSPTEPEDFARRVGIEDVRGFVETVSELREHRRLPPWYVTKKEAERRGWRPGRNLCAVAPGKAIGGDVFHDFEHRLPEKPGRRWREADLDARCGSRGPKRLVFSNDGLLYVTTDHYATFIPVPE